MTDFIFKAPYKLYPHIKLPQPTIVGFSYTINEIKLFEYLSISVQLFDHRGQVLEIRLLTMDGDAYKAWGDDDLYVINWIRKQLQPDTEL